MRSVYCITRVKCKVVIKDKRKLVADALQRDLDEIENKSIPKVCGACVIAAPPVSGLTGDRCSSYSTPTQSTSRS